MKEYITTQDLIDRFKVSRQAIDKWRSCGMPSYKFGYRTIRYHMDEVEQWLLNKGSERAKTK